MLLSYERGAIAHGDDAPQRFRVYFTPARAPQTPQGPSGEKRAAGGYRPNRIMMTICTTSMKMAMGTCFLMTP